MPESFFTQLRNDPATKDLLSNLGTFAGTQAGSLVGRIGGGGTSNDDGPSTTDQVKGGAMQGAGEAMGEGKSTVFGGIKGALKGLFGRRGSGSKRPTNIYEQNFIGVPVDVAYASWKDYAEFPKYMKGPENVSEQDEDGKTKWTAKIFLNRRSWTATVTEDIENYKIKWETEAPKGTIDGTVTFHAVSEHLTLMVYILEYRPKGFFERIGNLNRVVGRRARLDAKHFARYVMMQDFEQGESDDEEAGNERPDDEVDEEEVDEEADRADSDPGGPDEDTGESDEAAVATPKEPEEPEEVERTARAPRSPREPRKPRG